MSTSIQHLSHPKYRPDVDGLRAIAVLSVVTFHAFPNFLKGGFIGVDVFFVISGFLISTIIFENLEKGTFSFLEFYIRRIKRIFPALSIVLISCFVFGWFSLLPDELNQLGKHMAAGAGFVSNVVLWSESGYFDNAAETKPLLHLWSLGIEEQFYIIWPVLLWLAWKFRFNLFLLTIFFAISSFSLNILIVYQDSVAAFYSPITRFWELLLGALLAWYSLHHDIFTRHKEQFFKRRENLTTASEVKSKHPLLWSNTYSILGILYLIGGLFLIHDDLIFPGFWALVPVLGAVLIILGGQKAWLNQKILSNKILVFFGLISFPLYLWHWPILSFGRIIYFDTPPLKFRIAAVFLSIVLAWLTMVLIERPFRFGTRYSTLKITILSILLACIGVSGVLIYRSDFSHSHSFDKLYIKWKRAYVIGSSLTWYQGKDDWLFLGNLYDNTVAKLKLAITPSEKQIETTVQNFSKIADTAAPFGTKTVLIVGPDKSSIYPEYLPEELTPSPIKYISFFLSKLKELPNLIVYDPTNDLISAKKSQGILYWMTDTHWNYRGAYVAYVGLCNQLKVPIPNVDFVEGAPHSGDLIGISKLENFPLHPEDSWDVIWQEKPVWTEKEIPNEQKTTFGPVSVVTNKKPLSDAYVWVVGDSFSGALRQYFNATFQKVRYVGHWSNKLNDLSHDFLKAQEKPDYIFIVKVERSF